MHNESDARPLTIQFPGAVPAGSMGQDSLAQQYDLSRQVAARVGLPILGDKFSPLSRRLNESGADELVEAAEEIHLANCARQVVKETARYEEAYAKVVESYRLDSDECLDRLRARRDAAVAVLLKTREKIARIRRLEALAERSAPCLEQSALEPHRRSGAM